MLICLSTFPAGTAGKVHRQTARQECKWPVVVVVVSRTPATAGKVPAAASLADVPIGGVERIVIGSDLHPSYITVAALHDSSYLARVSHCQIITFSA